MLHLTSFQSAKDIERLASSSDPLRECWLVADIKSKLEIQGYFKKSSGGFIGTSVLRVSELWDHFFRKLNPNIQVLSDIALRTLLRDWIRTEYSHLSAGSDDLIIEALKLFYPLIRNKDSIETFQEWTEGELALESLWFSYAIYAEKFLKHLETQNRVPQFGLVHELLDENFQAESEAVLKSSFLPQILWVDLGLELSIYEAELFKKMSTVFEVRILLGEAYCSTQYELSLRPYQDLAAFCSQKLILKPDQVNASVTTMKFSSQLTECIWVLEKIKSFLMDGVSIQQIGVVADQIEPYWSLLSELSIQYKIPFAKSVTYRTSTLPVSQKWLSQLKIQAGEISYPLIEQGYLERNEIPRFRQSQYFAELSQLLDQEDLRYRRTGQELVKLEEIDSSAADTLISRSEFAELLIQQIKKVKDDPQGSFFESTKDIVFQLMSQFAGHEVLSKSSWIFWLEETLNKYEVKVDESEPYGIFCSNLSSLNSIPLDYVFILGTTENSFKDSEYSLLGSAVLSKMSRELGLDYRPTSQRKEAELSMILAEPNAKIFLCYPLTQMDGRENNPSRLWIEKASGAKGEDVISITNKSQFFQKTADLISFEWQADFSWSASKVSDYDRCPFVFAAKNIFKLDDPEVVDLDLGSRSQGTLKHLILQSLSIEPFKLDWSDSDLIQLFEKSREQLKLQGLTEEIWELKKKQLLLFSKKFLAAEANFKKTQNGHQVIAVEKKFEFEYQGMKFSGSIDRIDRTGDGRYHLIDFKSSKNSLNAAKSWHSKRQFQLPFYMKALESLFPGYSVKEQFGSAYYFIFKDMSREKGLSHESSFNLDVGESWTTDQIEELVAKTFDSMIELHQKIKTGPWKPQPKKPLDCVECQWRKVCRAPHLQ